mmetsp:Transcript_39140/g.110854  ORF Transcript_39140/g.110854 Transcript_39140/m.110854 type:complete len:216 (+) Transcript_39140:712-1359(+)
MLRFRDMEAKEGTRGWDGGACRKRQFLPSTSSWLYPVLSSNTLLAYTMGLSGLRASVMTMAQGLVSSMLDSSLDCSLLARGPARVSSTRLGTEPSVSGEGGRVMLSLGSTAAADSCRGTTGSSVFREMAGLTVADGMNSCADSRAWVVALEVRGGTTLACVVAALATDFANGFLVVFRIPDRAFNTALVASLASRLTASNSLAYRWGLLYQPYFK